MDESKQVVLLVLTITRPILVRFGRSWACSHGFKPAFDGSEPAAGRVRVQRVVPTGVPMSIPTNTGLSHQVMQILGQFEKVVR